MFGPALSGEQDPQKLKIEDPNDSTAPERSAQVVVCIVMLLLRYLSWKISCETFQIQRVPKFDAWVRK